LAWWGDERKIFFDWRGGRIAFLTQTYFGKMATPWSRNHLVDDKIPPYKKKCTVAL